MATHKPAVYNVQLTSSVVEYFEATAETKIMKATICNTTASNDTYTVYLVPSGETAGVANTVIYNVQVLAGAEQDIPIAGHSIKTGWTIEMSSGAGSRLTPYITVVEF